MVVALGAQAAGQVGDLEIGLFEGLKLGQLAADVHVDADDLQAGQAGGLGIDLGRAGDRDAELVFLLAGGDLLMGPGVDVGVDADGDRGGHAQRGGDFGQGAQFGFAIRR